MQFDFYDIITILSAYLIGNISPAIILGKINGIDINMIPTYCIVK